MDRAGAFRRDYHARPAADDQNRRAFRAVSRIWFDGAPWPAGVDSYGRRDGVDADQGFGVAVCQLRRLRHGDELGGGGNLAESLAPETLTCGSCSLAGGPVGICSPGWGWRGNFCGGV